MDHGGLRQGPRGTQGEAVSKSQGVREHKLSIQQTLVWLQQAGAGFMQCWEHAQDQYLVNKGCSSLGIHFFPITEGPTKQEGLMHGGCRCVGVKLLNIPRHTSKGCLLLWVPIDSDIPLSFASCIAN